MNMQEVRAKAKEQGVKAKAGTRKADLIHMIQAGEGNPQCFGADWRFDCQQMDCCWRKDCLT